MTERDERTTALVVADAELAALFERIARAIPGAARTRVGLDPHTFLRVYAELLEQGEAVSLMTCHEPPTDPQLG